MFSLIFYYVAKMQFISVAGLKFFGLNDFGIQFVFYFIYINLQISVAFLGAVFFSNVKTATGLKFLLYWWVKSLYPIKSLIN